MYARALLREKKSSEARRHAVHPGKGPRKETSSQCHRAQWAGGLFTNHACRLPAARKVAAGRRSEGREHRLALCVEGGIRSHLEAAAPRRASARLCLLGYGIQGVEPNCHFAECSPDEFNVQDREWRDYSSRSFVRCASYGWVWKQGYSSRLQSAAHLRLVRERTLNVERTHGASCARASARSRKLYAIDHACVTVLEGRGA